MVDRVLSRPVGWRFGLCAEQPLGSMWMKRRKDMAGEKSGTVTVTERERMTKFDAAAATIVGRLRATGGTPEGAVILRVLDA